MQQVLVCAKPLCRLAQFNNVLSFTYYHVEWEWCLVYHGLSIPIHGSTGNSGLYGYISRGDGWTCPWLLRMNQY